MPPNTQFPTIVIVGAGFCGTVLTVNLLRRPPSAATDILLIERTAQVGRGVAYAQRNYPYLLNVPAGRLSADSKDPLQFLRFAQRTLPHADTEDFLPRALYGDYLQDLLLCAERAAPRHVRLKRVQGTVSGIRRQPGEARLWVDCLGGERVLADDVVLALGNPPPAVLPVAAALHGHGAYRPDPWEPPRGVTAQHTVLIIGNGLTMTDVTLSLSEVPTQTPQILAISRRGLIPQPQTAFRAAAVQGDGEALLAVATSIRRVMRASRELAHAVEAIGGDWREVVTFLRNLAPRIWRQLPDTERRRFVRHVQCYWDVHRHRLPPQLGAHMARLRESGRLRSYAGRIEHMRPAGEQIHVLWRPRGGAETTTLRADFIINATGPNYGLVNSADTLIQALLAEGLISADPLNVGLRTGAHGACIDSKGVPSEHLYYLGPLLRADHWEATAATELRNHAEQLAAHLRTRAANPPHAFETHSPSALS